MMEPFLADLINNPKISKVIRYAIVSVVSLFILYLGILCVVESQMIIGKAFGVILCALTLVAVGYLFNKIHKN